VIRNTTIRKRLPAFAALACFIAAPAMALEVLTEEDFVQGVVVEDQLVRLADNVLVLFDTSSSMNDEYMDSGKSKLDVALAEFKRRNSYFPAIGHNFGIYEYTPWRVVYPMQRFDRDKIADALETLPKEGSGPTPLATAIEEADKIVEGLSGRTVVFLFYDGDYTGKSPDPALWRMIKENDVCLLMVSSADEEENEVLSENISKLNSCSRVIPYQWFLDRPEYTSNALYDVRATEKVVTTTEQRISDVLVDNIEFGFDKTELSADDKSELDALGKFMADNPQSYAVLAGYTDNVGIEDYNEHLSRLRATMVAAYLADNYDIDWSRLVVQWQGSDNPIADNSTAEGRAANRRVEIAVGGI
jgi:OOP family OmpA-OmpF porin